MKQLKLTVLLTVLASIVKLNAFAHDISVANDDGKIIYYNFINDSTELAVTYKTYDNMISAAGCYSGAIIIPEVVSYDNTIYSVTRIDDYAFQNSISLTSVKIPNSVTVINDGAFYGCI